MGRLHRRRRFASRVSGGPVTFGESNRMKRIFHFAALSSLCTLAAISDAAPLCKTGERVVFSCTAGKKMVSLCAIGQLQQDGGRLIYRFGRDADHLELEHGANSNPAKSSYTFDYESWAKGASRTITFERGEFKYIVNHAAGVFGVDGGPNVASVRVLRNQKQVADIACHEPTAVDHLYDELGNLGLPSAAAL